MWHQHVCLIGCLAAIMVSIDGYFILRTKVDFNLDGPGQFDLGQTLPNVHSMLQSRANLQILGSLICFLYWLVAYLFAVFPPQLTRFRTKVRAYTSFVFWHLLVQPYLIVSLAHCVYTFAMVLEEAGYFNADFHQLFLNLFDSIKNQTDTQEKLHTVEYIENLQYRFRCCGAYSLRDWVGVDVSPGGNQSSHDSSSLWITENGLFYPYYNYPVYLPKSCCNSEQAHECTQTTWKEMADMIKQNSMPVVTKRFPVYSVGCVDAMASVLGQDLCSRLTLTFMLSLVLHILQCTCCFLAYHQSKPTHWDVRHPRRTGSRNTYRQSILFGQTERLNRQPHYRIFRGSYGFVSNSQMLMAYHGMALIAHPTTVQRAFSAVKEKWLAKGINIGWSLEHSKGSSKPTFVRRFPLRQDIKVDKLRLFLRQNIPLFEAIIYADNNSQRDVEINAMYYGYIVCILRIFINFLFGCIISYALVKTFVPRDSGTDNDGMTAAKSEQTKVIGEDPSEEKIKKDNADLSKQVAVYAGLFIQVTIIFGSIFSRRCRCIYLLLIPSLGLTVGRSYLAAELLHVTLTGPAATAERNLRAAAGTLNCLIELAQNMSTDAKEVYEQAKIGDQLSGAQGYIDQVKQSSQNLVDKVDAYQESANKMLSEIMKAEEQADNAEKQLNKDETAGGDEVKNPDDDDPSISMNKKLKDSLVALSTRMADRDSKNTKAIVEKSKNAVKNVWGNFSGSVELLANITAKIEAGAEIERLMKKRLTATCMIFHKSRGLLCTKSAQIACAKVSWIVYYSVCMKSASKGSACPKESAIEKAVEECGSSVQNIGMNLGFGAMFFQSMDNLNQLSESFNMRIQSKLFQMPKSFGFITEKLSAAAAVARKTQNAVQVLFSISLLLSTLLKLLALLVFRKAFKYISNYLTNIEFDNIYVEDTFEAIDARRVKQERENLLPLKGFEKKKVFWRRIGYTKAELGKVLITVIKCMGLCIGLLMLFIIDVYLAETISLLDIATQGDINIGGGAPGNSTMEAVESLPPPGLKGDGIFFILIGRTLDVLTDVSRKNMAYELSVCSPRVQYTHASYRTRFTISAVIMLLVGVFSGYLLRSRHIIVDFFYPMQSKSRTRHLYNVLLVDRRRHMTICRNVLVHQVRQGNLQAEAEERSQRSTLYQLSPFLARLLGKNHSNCVICMDRFKTGRDVYVCPYDDNVVCKHCLRLYFKDLDEDCITCLDRDPPRLLREYKKCVRMKRELATGMVDI